MYRVMKALIAKHYYAGKEDVSEKLDTFYAFGKLTEAQYTELVALANEVYGEEETA